MVHGRPVYIDGYTPRVKGYSPGLPSWVCGSKSGRDSGPYSDSKGSPDSVRFSSPAPGAPAVGISPAVMPEQYGAPADRRTVRLPTPGTPRVDRAVGITLRGLDRLDHPEGLAG